MHVGSIWLRWNVRKIVNSKYLHFAREACISSSFFNLHYGFVGNQRSICSRHRIDPGSRFSRWFCFCGCECGNSLVLARKKGSKNLLKILTEEIIFIQEFNYLQNPMNKSTLSTMIPSKHLRLSWICWGKEV